MTICTCIDMGAFTAQCDQCAINEGVKALNEASISTVEAARAISAAAAGPTPEEIAENIERLSRAIRHEGDSR